MTKLKGLLLTEGMHGMISQVEGLAKALDLDFIHEKIELNNFWKLIPPKITPIHNFVFKNKIDNDLNIVISCGRKSVIPSLFLKKKFKDKIVNIHIQDPKVSFKHFDLIISPEHDGIKGENVITTRGSIHYLTKKEITENASYLSLSEKKKKIVTFVIGGPNKYYKYSDQQIHVIFNKVKTIFTPDKFKIVVIPSYRTPEEVIKKAYNTFSVNHYVVKKIDKKAYLSSLAIADYIIVTCDSTSMISEAAVTGKPVYMAMLKPKRNIRRFGNFYTQFKELGIAKELSDSIDNWSYDKLDEVNRIAPIIREKMKNNGII